VKRALLVLAACASPKHDIPPGVRPVDEPLETAALDVLQAFPGIDFLQSPNAAFYEHLGDPAEVRNMVLLFEVHDHRAHAIEVRSVELLHRVCRANRWESRKPIELEGLEVMFDRGNEPESGAHLVASGPGRVTIPSLEPRRYAMHVNFKNRLRVYQKCDDFAYAIDLVVDSIRHRTEIVFDVTRFSSEG
jgi:hypothetical protein